MCVQEKGERDHIQHGQNVVKITTTLGRQQRSQYDSIIKPAATPSKQADFMFGTHERGSGGYLPRSDAVTAFLE